MAERLLHTGDATLTVESAAFGALRRQKVINGAES